MLQIPKDLKTRNTLLIGTGVVLLATALTFWNWKSSHKNTSVKHKKSDREVVSKKKDENNDLKQSQVDKEETEQNVLKPEIAVKVTEKEVIVEASVSKEEDAEASVAKEIITEEVTIVTEEPAVAVEELTIVAEETTDAAEEEVVVAEEAIVQEEKVVPVDDEIVVEEKSVEISESVVIVEAEPIVAESHFDESSSTKSQPLSTASTEETDIRTPEHPIDTPKQPVFDWTDAPVMVKEENVAVDETDSIEADMPQFSKPSTLTADAPEFVPRAFQPKKSSKKFLSREQLIEQQRQHHIPRSKARCSHWPHCTNNNCKFFHPFKPCRAGDECLFGDRCMFVHPSDCTTPTREKSPESSIILN